MSASLYFRQQFRNNPLLLDFFHTSPLYNEGPTSNVATTEILSNLIIIKLCKYSFPCRLICLPSQSQVPYHNLLFVLSRQEYILSESYLDIWKCQNSHFRSQIFPALTVITASRYIQFFQCKRNWNNILLEWYTIIEVILIGSVTFTQSLEVIYSSSRKLCDLSAKPTRVEV